MARRSLIVANWKMHVTPSEAAAFASDFLPLLGGSGSESGDPTVGESGANRPILGDRLEIAIAPAFPALDRLAQALAGSGVELAAQNFHAAESGAYTGEVSVAMLEDLGCRYALVGHSERRQIFGEDDAIVSAKALRLATSSLGMILCIGETLEERERNATLEIVGGQLAAVLDRLAAEGRDGLERQLVVAYEPVWAIGTGRTATADLAQEVHAFIRKTLSEHLGDAGQSIRILYGGSVKPSNARELLAMPDVDGALVGGASLDPNDFASIAACCS